MFSGQVCPEFSDLCIRKVQILERKILELHVILLLLNHETVIGRTKFKFSKCFLLLHQLAALYIMIARLQP